MKKTEVALAKFGTMLSLVAKRLGYCIVALVLQSVLYHWEIFCCTAKVHIMYVKNKLNKLPLE